MFPRLNAFNQLNMTPSLLKALNDYGMSAHEFGIIITKFEQYAVLKNQFQAKPIRQLSNGDVEQLKTAVCCAVEEFRKNYSSHRFKLTFENNLCHLHIIKTCHKGHSFLHN